MRLDSTEMANILLARYFRLPVCTINGNTYAVLRAAEHLPLGVIIEVTGPKSLGDFYIIDWEAELLERITLAKPFINAVKALREDESFDFTTAESRFDMHVFAQYCEAEFVNQKAQTVASAYKIGSDLYDLCFAAEVLDADYLYDALYGLAEEQALEISYKNDQEGMKDATVVVGAFMAFSNLEEHVLAKQVEDSLYPSKKPAN